MILEALIIILVILVLANFALGVINRVFPPCADASEYFKGVKMLPDGVSAELGSIPTHTYHDYVGVKTFSTGIPGTMGITSWNNDKIEGYVTLAEPLMEELVDDGIDERLCKTKHPRTYQSSYDKLDRDTADRISAIIPALSQKTSGGKISTSTDYGTITQFDDTFAGSELSGWSRKSTANGNSRTMSYRSRGEEYIDSSSDGKL